MKKRQEEKKHENLDAAYYSNPAGEKTEKHDL